MGLLCAFFVYFGCLPRCAYFDDTLIKDSVCMSKCKHPHPCNISLYKGLNKTLRIPLPSSKFDPRSRIVPQCSISSGLWLPKIKRIDNIIKTT